METIETFESYPENEPLPGEVRREFISKIKEYVKSSSEKTVGFSEKDWNEALDEITRGLKIRLANNKEGLRGKYEALIADDEYVQAALGILKGAKVPKDVFKR
jgi:hypothetical protein